MCTGYTTGKHTGGGGGATGGLGRGSPAVAYMVRVTRICVERTHHHLSIEKRLEMPS